MASLITRLKALIRDPRTQALIDRAPHEAATPENRRRLIQVRARDPLSVPDAGPTTLPVTVP